MFIYFFVIKLNHVCRKRLMNSPLFFRKVLRTQIEPDYQNLETFQKSQIKNKVSSIQANIKLLLNIDR